MPQVGKKYTREEFIEAYGMGPEEYAAKQGKQVIDARPEAGTNAFGGRTLTEADAPDWLRKASEHMAAVNPVLNVGNFVASQLGFADRTPKSDETFTRAAQDIPENLTAGVIQTPGAPAMLYGLAGAGVEALTTDKSFQDSLFTDEGLQNVTGTLSNLQKQMSEKGLSPEEVEAKLSQFTESDDFYKYMIENMRPGLSFGTEWFSMANEVAGQEKRPDRQNILDDITQAAGSAAVGLPASVVKAVSGQVAKSLVNRLMSSRSGRVAVRAAEAFTPITLPLTPGNYALNAAAGAGIDVGVRAAIGEEFFPENVEQEKLTAAQEADQADLEAAQIGEVGTDSGPSWETVAVGLGALAGAGLLTRALIRKLYVPESVGAGPTLEEQSKNPLSPQLRTTDKIIAEAVDQLKPVRAPARAMGGEEADQYVEAVAGVNTGPAGENAILTAKQFGYLYGMDRRTVPFTQLRMAIDQMDPQTQKLTNDYITALNARDDRLLRQSDLQRDIIELEAELHTAQRSNRPQKIAAIQRKLADKQAQIQSTMVDDPSARPNIEGWDNRTIDGIIQAGRQNEQVQKFHQAYKQLAGDMNEYALKNDLITQDEYNSNLARRPNYMPLMEDPYAGVQHKSAARLGGFVKRELTPGRTEDELGFYKPDVARNLTDDAAGKVNQALNPLDAMSFYMDRVIRRAQGNRAVKDIVDEFTRLQAGNPGGPEYVRRIDFSGGRGSARNAITKAEARLPHNQKLLDRPDVVTYHRNGMIEAVWVSDPQIARALNFTPHGTIPVANHARRMLQFGLTGKGAPWFAPIAAGWETSMAHILRRSGRSAGTVETMARKTFSNSPMMQKAIDHIGIDPTFYLNMLRGAPSYMYNHTRGLIARNIADEVATESGLFGEIAKMPGGRQFLEGWSDSMLKAFDESTVGMLMNNNVMHAQFMVDAYNARSNITNAMASTNDGAVKTFLKPYAAMLDAIHNTNKIPFFAQNYALLEKKHGAGQIPKRELTKLLNDTRMLSGDMSRASLNKYVNYVTSTIPYGNVIIQSMRYTFGELARNPATRTRLIAGVALPVIAAERLMSNWDEDAKDWWYHQLPEWQRNGYVAVPKENVLLGWANGEQVPFFPVDAEGNKDVNNPNVYMVRFAPEFIPLIGAIRAGLMSTGVLSTPEGETVGQELKRELASGAEAMFGIATNPLVNIPMNLMGQRVDLSAPLRGRSPVHEIQPTKFGGVDENKIRWYSTIHKNIAEAIGNTIGTAGRIGIETLDATQFGMSKQGMEFSEAFGKAIDEAQFEAVSRLPDIPMMWDSPDTRYKFTQDAERVSRIRKMLEPVLAQRQIDNASSRSDTGNRKGMMLEQNTPLPPTITDPMLRDITETTHAMLNTGEFKDLNDQYTRLDTRLSSIDAGRVLLPPKERQELRNDTLYEMNSIRSRQSQIIDEWFDMMDSRHGSEFRQKYGAELTPESIVKAVEQNARQADPMRPF